jgi:hemerythrin-like domain-containing protein
MDAIMLLIGDHNRVRGLFKRFEKAEEAKDQATAQKLADTILNELDVHAEIEEQYFYPACKKAGVEPLTEVVDEGQEEHHVAKILIAEIRQAEPGSDQWSAKMKVLQENIEHHADEEEKEMFPKSRRAIGAENLKALAEQMETLKQKLGAPTLADKIDLTEATLSKLATEQEIPGRSSMSKEELAAAVAPE